MDVKWEKYLSTHPENKERIASMQKECNRLNGKGSKEEAEEAEIAEDVKIT